LAHLLGTVLIDDMFLVLIILRLLMVVDAEKLDTSKSKLLYK